jgi:signal transduction histidine kinase
VSRLAALARQLAIVFAKARLDAKLAAERSLLDRRVQELTTELGAAQAELAQSVRRKDELLAGMSHELRTPLTPIIGLAQALQAGVYGPLSARQLTRLHTIEESGKHVLAILNDMLDWPTAEV